MLSFVSGIIVGGLLVYAYLVSSDETFFYNEREYTIYDEINVETNSGEKFKILIVTDEAQD